MNRPADDHPHTTGATPARQQVAYLVNQYPKVSHSFIRREIQALERLGLTVHRFSQRGWNDALVDPEDISEQARTRYILKAGLLRIFAATCGAVMASPLRFAQAMGQAWRLSRQADRAPIFHLIYLAEACWLGAELKRRGVPHLHAHFGTNSAQIAMLAHTLGGPAFSFTVHGPEEFDKPLMLHLGEKIRHSAFVVAISSFGRSQLYRWVDVAQWPKVHTVHCGLDESFHAGASAQPCLAQRLVCIGRLCEQKGQMLLLQAMRLLRERGLSFELVLAGDGEMRGALEAQIQQLGLAQQVRITGCAVSARAFVRRVVHPDLFSRLGIQGDNALIRRADVHHGADDERGDLVARGVLARLVRPRACQRTHIGGRDLLERRVTHAARVVAVCRPILLAQDRDG